MALEHFAVEARRRSGWEALDLGLVMLRHWRTPVYRAWFATWGLFVLAMSPLLWWYPGWFGLLVWWLKPLFDRVLLKVFAEAAFGAAPSVKDVWRSLPGLIRHSGLFAALTVRRLSTMRSFLLPIVQLENQRGGDARARRKVLSRRSSSFAVWLTFACVHFVAFFELSILVLAQMLLPREAPDLFEWNAYFQGEQTVWMSVAVSLAWLAAETVVEPYYVAAGFSLYLARRSELEGWDIEVAFRRLSRRKAAEAGVAAPVLKTVAFAALGLALVLAVPEPARAAMAASRVESPREAIDGVLRDPVFGHREPDTTWQRRSVNEEPEPPPSGDWAKVLRRLVSALASLVQNAVYVLAVALVAFLAVLLYRHRRDWLALPASANLPETLFGFDVRPESLPADVGAAARDLLRAGDPAASLSLLYRGALSALLHRRQIDFRRGDTEADCLGRVRGRLDGAGFGYFSRLLDAWKQIAYAHMQPRHADIAGLCDEWQTHFGGAK